MEQCDVLDETLQFEMVALFSSQESQAKVYVTLKPEKRKRWVLRQLNMLEDKYDGVEFENLSLRSYLEQLEWSGGGSLEKKS